MTGDEALATLAAYVNGSANRALRVERDDANRRAGDAAEEAAALRAQLTQLRDELETARRIIDGLSSELDIAHAEAARRVE